jgi:non-heme chloroperoxidase
MSNGDGVFAPQEAPFARIFDIQVLISRRVIPDYVATHGTSTLAGINFVDAGIKADPALVGDNLRNLPLMASEDLTTNIAATRAFVHGCFSNQPTADDFETMLSFNMMVPPKVRAGLSGRPLDATEIMSKLKLPVLVTHGAKTAMPNWPPRSTPPRSSRAPGFRSMRGQATPRSTRTRHVSNTELAAFVREANKTN